MNQGPPPQLPPGWIALWDETSQRYYYVEQATGTTQWELPNGASSPAGEASSYGGGYPEQQVSPYSQYPPQAGAVATAYPTQEGTPTGELNPDGTDRGIGKVFSGFSGGAITGGLLGYAAGKYFNKPKQQNQYQYQYQHPPPPATHNPPFGLGFGRFSGFGGGNNKNGGGEHQGGRNEYYGGENSSYGGGGGEHHGGHNNEHYGGHNNHGGPGGYGGPGGPGGKFNLPF